MKANCRILTSAWVDGVLYGPGDLIQCSPSTLKALARMGRGEPYSPPAPDAERSTRSARRGRTATTEPTTITPSES